MVAQSDFIEVDRTISRDDVKDMLFTRFERIDDEQAKQDVLPFIRNPDELTLWSADFFMNHGVVEMILSEPTTGDRTTIDGKLYAWVTGFGCVEAGGESVCIYDESLHKNGNTVGEMG